MPSERGSVRIISPKSDVGAKEMFRNEIVLKYFISDMLGIPVERIKAIRLRNTFLRRIHHKKKQGILDVSVELNDDTKIDIEIQIHAGKYWDKRQLFYLSKLYVEDLRSGDDYSKLKRCVAISIVDFNYSDREEYHNVYRLRDEQGNEFSDMLELHTLELRKKLTGRTVVDDWIRLFNARKEEDLDMIKTKNAGIQEAIRELKTMSLGKRLRMEYEAHLKAVRDRKAEDEYVREEGIRQGKELGMKQGEHEAIETVVRNALAEGMSDEAIKRLTQCDQSMIDAVRNSINA